MSKTINVDRFTRLKQTVQGSFAPSELPRLVPFLAGADGEISYTMSGNLAVDPAGGQERRVKCIICGWFLLSDPVTLAPIRYSMEVASSLILVCDETELPPLEMESEDEDYIVCGPEVDIAERVEEEILLNLPVNAVNRSEMPGNGSASATGGGNSAVVTKVTADGQAAEAKKISPFAKLVGLKKK